MAGDDTAKALGEGALGHLAAAMAHEVRNPLNSIAIHIELMETRLKKMAAAVELETLKRSLTVMAREVDRIDHILEGYLDYAGPSECSRKPTRIAELLSAVADRAQEAARAKGVQVAVESAPAGGTWQIDPGALAQALDAMVGNAVEACSRGGHVSLRASEKDAQGRIEVEDDGEGMSEETVRGAFQLGFTTRSGRPGLGLTVAKQIVKAHSGSTHAHSAGLGRGAMLRIEIPLDVDDE